VGRVSHGHKISVGWATAFGPAVTTVVHTLSGSI